MQRGLRGPGAAGGAEAVRFARGGVPVLALALALSLAGCGGEAGGRGAQAAAAVGPDELEALVESGADLLLLDVRTREEFDRGHLPGARLLPHDELAARLGELEEARDEPVVVYCERGGRASAAARVLREAGFRDVRELSGHMARWRREGRRIEGGASAPR